MFDILVLAASLGLSAQATPKPVPTTKANLKPTTAAKAPGSPSAAPAHGPIRVPTVVRKADCVLVLKGQLQRQVPAPVASPKAATATKLITEQFAYELPGVLEEEIDPLGPVRFRFTPAEDLHNNPAAHGRLTLLDDAPGPGMPPVRADATELANAAVFLFEARGRGQSLIPVAGSVNLRGRIQSTAAMAKPVAPGTEQRPLLSVPLPSLKDQLGRPGTPHIQFQGLALWAWANTAGPMTVSGSLNYAGPTAAGRVNGTVEISLRISALSK